MLRARRQAQKMEKDRVGWLAGWLVDVLDSPLTSSQRHNLRLKKKRFEIYFFMSTEDSKYIFSHVKALAFGCPEEESPVEMEQQSIFLRISTNSLIRSHHRDFQST
jgi:hypothetical protein